MERSGTLVAGQTKEAAVLRKGGNRKKRTSAQHFFLLPLVIPLRTPRQAQEAATQGTPISPLGFLLGGLCGGLFVIYVFLVIYVMRTYVLSCLRWFEIADRVRNERVDGWLSSPLNLYDSS